MQWRTGTDTFDMLGVMRRWVERGEAPDKVIASRVEYGKAVRTRPLCPYPPGVDVPRHGKHGRRGQLRLQMTRPNGDGSPRPTTADVRPGLPCRVNLDAQARCAGFASRRRAIVRR